MNILINILACIGAVVVIAAFIVAAFYVVSRKVVQAVYRRQARVLALTPTPTDITQPAT